MEYEKAWPLESSKWCTLRDWFWTSMLFIINIPYVYYSTSTTKNARVFGGFWRQFGLVVVFVEREMEVVELVVVDDGGGGHHEVDAGAVFWEGDDVADVFVVV